MPELPAMVFRDLEVTGPFILHTDLDEKWVNFTNVVFDEPVDLSYVHARGIGFYGCELRKGANLSRNATRRGLCRLQEHVQSKFCHKRRIASGCREGGGRRKGPRLHCGGQCPCGKPSGNRRRGFSGIADACPRSSTAPDAAAELSQRPSLRHSLTTTPITFSSS